MAHFAATGEGDVKRLQDIEPPEFRLRVGVHVQQLKRYEAGISQPTLDVIRNMAIAFGVASDQLLFDKDERGPDDGLKLQFEAVSRFDPESRKVVQQVLDSMILQQEARRWSSER